MHEVATWLFNLQPPGTRLPIQFLAILKSLGFPEQLAQASVYKVLLVAKKEHNTEVQASLGLIKNTGGTGARAPPGLA